MTEKIIKPKAAAVMTSTHFCAPLKRASAADGAAEAAAPSSAFSASSPSSQPTSEAAGSLRTRAA